MRTSIASIAAASAATSGASMSTLVATSSSSGPSWSVRRWITRRTSGLRLDGGADRRVHVGARGLADQQALHLDREHDRDRAEQQADRDAADRVVAGLAGDDREPETDEREQEAEERADVLEQHDGQLGRLRPPDELPPRRVRRGAVATRGPRCAARTLSSTTATPSTTNATAGDSSSCGLQELLDALVQREQRPEREQHERDDERPEVALGAVAELVLARRRACGPAHRRGTAAPGCRCRRPSGWTPPSSTSSR